MGQSIRAGSEPGRIVIEIVCDAPHHGDHEPRATIALAGVDFMVMRQMAAKEGWSRIAGGEWRGPCCLRIKRPGG